LDVPVQAYRPPHGRRMAPEPAVRPAVDRTAPQTWNRYAYVRNSPLEAIAPLGLSVQKFGDCYYDTVSVYVMGEFQGYDTQLLGCVGSSGGGASGGGVGGSGGPGTPPQKTPVQPRGAANNGCVTRATVHSAVM